MTAFNLINHINGKDKTIVLWLFNIGVEKYWNEKKLSVKDSRKDMVVNHIEEINILITKSQDILILRNMPNEDYLSELESRGCDIPHIICPESADENTSISEIVLNDASIKKKIEVAIQSIKHQVGEEADVVFVPYGISEWEEKIAKQLEIRLFGASSEICKMINDKVYTRELAIANNFKVPDAIVCKSVEEVVKHAHIFLEKYKKIIIKEPCGTSGKGLWVIDSEEKLNSVLLVIMRFLRKLPEFKILVEQWCQKKCDLNYQIYIGENGEVEVFSVKQQILEETVYIGSLMSPGITEEVMNQCKEVGVIIGENLRKIGYVGIAGVDALLLEDDELIPIIEINARFTLSTYLSFFKVKNMLVFYKDIHLMKDMNYSTIKDKLMSKGLWKRQCDKSGAFLFISETINGARLDNIGRVFCVVNAETEEELKEIQERIICVMEER